MLETLIIFHYYYRGTTQIDKNVHFPRTNIRSSFITGLVPVSAYSFSSGLMNGFKFRRALKSPFSNNRHTAIPPPAALCDLV